jgi:hypothetical protein
LITDEQILLNLKRHESTPEVSTSSYFWTRVAELRDVWDGKHRLYLDTKYWVLLREAVLGRPKIPIHTEILETLRSLVQAGKVICPLSDAAYVEVMQQSDTSTRECTARLIDELSLGIALQTEEYRVRTEMFEFLKNPSSDYKDRMRMMWVKTGFVLGGDAPSISQFDDRQNAVMQKSYIDIQWEQTVLDSSKNHKNGSQFNMADAAEMASIKNREHANEIKSFKLATSHEFSACIKHIDHSMAVQLLKDEVTDPTEEQTAHFIDRISGGIHNALILKPKMMAKKIPTSYVHAMCHANARWNKALKLNGNWLLDFHHACAALPYFHIMFTEKALRVHLTDGNMQLDKLFELPILSDEKEVFRYLKGVELYF